MAVLLTLLCSVAVVCGQDELDAVSATPHSRPPPATKPTLPPSTTPVLEENTRIVSLHSSPDDLHLLNAVNQVKAQPFVLGVKEELELNPFSTGTHFYHEFQI